MSNDEGSEPASGAGERSRWLRSLSRYERPDSRQATAQLLNTLLPYVAVWDVMVGLLRIGLGYWPILPLLPLAAGLLVRTFVLFHDCCHGSFFPSKTANRVVGYLLGLLAFTPYEGWQRPHHLHHASTGDLDRRGHGDVWTLTVDEYRAAPWHTRFAYRVFRNPLVLFGIGPALVFLIGHRFHRTGSGPRERLSVWLTNLGLLVIGVAAYFTIGLKLYLVIQVPVMALTGSIGVLLFYVQHQYEEVYWERHADWDPVRAALEGSSYYQLPRVLEWFTGSIGYHHLHHLRPRIPNYRLRECAEQMPVLAVGAPLTVRGSLSSLSLHLWDETERKLVRFSGRPLRAPAHPAGSEAALDLGRRFREWASRTAPGFRRPVIGARHPQALGVWSILMAFALAGVRAGAARPAPFPEMASRSPRFSIGDHQVLARTGARNPTSERGRGGSPTLAVSAVRQTPQGARSAQVADLSTPGGRVPTVRGMGSEEPEAI